MLANNRIDALIGYLLKKIKRIRNVVVVMDGARSIQKQDTHARRGKIQDKNIQKLEKFCDLFRKVPMPMKRHYKAVQRAKVAAFNVRPMYAEIGSRLERAGITVVRAPYEADNYIARIADSYVISKDSDFYFHRNVECFAKLIGKPGKEQLVIFTKKEILEGLKINSNALTVLGVVSGNDYAENIRGHGLAKNLVLIQRLQNAGNTKSILERYCSNFKETHATTFTLAMDIFDRLHEDGATAVVLSTSDRFNDAIASFELRSEEIREQHRKSRTEIPGESKPKYIRFVKGHSKRSTERVLVDGKRIRPSRQRYKPRSVCPRKSDINWTSVSLNNPFGVLDEVSETNPPMEPKHTKKRKAQTQAESSSKLQPKKKLGKAVGFSKKALDTVLPPASAGATGKQLRESTKLLLKLKECAVITANIGVLAGKLRGYPEIISVIQKAVKAINQLMWLSQMATMYLIEALVDTNDAHLLQDIVGKTSGDGGVSYARGVMRLLKNKTTRVEGAVKKLSTLPNIEAFYLDENLAEDIKSKPLLDSNGTNLATSLRGIFIGKLPNLIASVVEEDPAKEEQVNDIMNTPKLGPSVASQSSASNELYDVVL